MTDTAKHRPGWRIKDHDGLLHIACTDDPRDGVLCGFAGVHPMEVFAADETSPDHASKCAACALLTTAPFEPATAIRSSGPYVGRHSH